MVASSGWLDNETRVARAQALCFFGAGMGVGCSEVSLAPKKRSARRLHGIRLNVASRGEKTQEAPGQPAEAAGKGADDERAVPALIGLFQRDGGGHLTWSRQRRRGQKWIVPRVDHQRWHLDV